MHGLMGQWAHRPMGPWAHEPTGPWAHVPMGQWFHGSMCPRAHGPMGTWAHGPMRTWAHGLRGPWPVGSFSQIGTRSRPVISPWPYPMTELQQIRCRRRPHSWPLPTGDTVPSCWHVAKFPSYSTCQRKYLPLINHLELIIKYRYRARILYDYLSKRNLLEKVFVK